MTRYHNVGTKNTPFTVEEEAIADIEETAWENGKVDRKWVTLREERNNKLNATDWTQMSDAPTAGKAAWATYRQELRDLPTITSDPYNPTWPTKPE